MVILSVESVKPVILVDAGISSSIITDVGIHVVLIDEADGSEVVSIVDIAGGLVSDVTREDRSVLHSIESLLVRE